MTYDKLSMFTAALTGRVLIVEVTAYVLFIQQRVKVRLVRIEKDGFEGVRTRKQVLNLPLSL